ncbi:MAG: cytochrome c [Rhodospirillaceae bacterium]|jgi:mono/diheme cytochrome c family protein|nr:cytochrome c [Rhodospirillaceae bacterium]MBT5374321.1 cytochrome c [Rhodospirillaceae bacterium]MBT5660039.1 cytochrome c [Rhodospirillaceae bacterium]MBT5751657.1 cytochrome c [Rhodospirillaceae bacterium]
MSAKPLFIVAGLFAVITFYLFTFGINVNGDDDLALGADLYARDCVECHGKNLEGEADWKTPLDDGGLRAPPHNESGHTWHHTDDHLFRYIKYGGKGQVAGGFKSNMPGFKDKLSDLEIYAVMAYIKSTWSPEIQERQAMMGH